MSKYLDAIYDETGSPAESAALLESLSMKPSPIQGRVLPRRCERTGYGPLFWCCILAGLALAAGILCVGSANGADPIRDRDIEDMRGAVELFKSGHSIGGELFTFAIIPHPTEQSRDSDSLIAALRDNTSLGELRRITRAKVLAYGVTSTTSEEEVLVRRFWDGGGKISHNWLVIARLQKSSTGHATLSPVFWCHWSVDLKSIATPRDISKVLTRFARQSSDSLLEAPQ